MLTLRIELLDNGTGNSKLRVIPVTDAGLYEIDPRVRPLDGGSLLDLKPGDRLLEADGTTLEVLSVEVIEKDGKKCAD